jgi:hypothetical protein
VTRRAWWMCLGLTLAAVPAAPLGAQVGHPPDASPYEDLRGRQAVTFSPGWIIPAEDPAGVGPGSGLMVAGRYELLLAGPVWLTTRIGYAAGLERTIKDPEVSGPARVVGTRDERLFLMDAGFGLNLTGNKSWHRIAPRLNGTLGIASTFDSQYDLGGYRFGTRFTIGYAVGARIVTGSPWEVNVDLSRMFWKNKYPDSYGGDGSASDESILGAGRLGPWTGNTILSIGVSRYFFR